MPDITPWWPQIKQLAPHLANDPDLPRLAFQLEGYAGMGMDTNHMLNAALHDGPLPVHRTAAALTFRLERHEYHPRGWPPSANSHSGPRRPPHEAPHHEHRRDRGISI